MSSPTDLEVSTSEIVKRRLIGLLVLVLLVFGLSVLLRGLGAPSVGEANLQTVVVPLGGSELPTADATAVLAESASPDVEEPLPAAPARAVTEPSVDQQAEPGPDPKPTQRKSETSKAVEAPPKAVEKEKTVTSPAPKKSRWYILLGSFSDAANANALAQRARGAGFSVDVSRIQSGGSTLNRVRAGPFKSESEAQSARATLIVEGLTGAKLQRDP
ncbi:MAG: SPOR domain-containing protein [Nevskiaceae bacterium]|jgi:cell division septation protein DedD|nr:MAG: SPOR domain-containing protein [Nevskiaceae bacterium]